MPIKTVWDDWDKSNSILKNSSAVKYKIAGMRELFPDVMKHNRLIFPISNHRPPEQKNIICKLQPELPGRGAFAGIPDDVGVVGVREAGHIEIFFAAYVKKRICDFRSKPCRQRIAVSDGKAGLFGGRRVFHRAQHVVSDRPDTTCLLFKFRFIIDDRHILRGSIMIIYKCILFLFSCI